MEQVVVFVVTTTQGYITGASAGFAFDSLSSAGRIDEVLSPRIFRLGARVTF